MYTPMSVLIDQSGRMEHTPLTPGGFQADLELGFHLSHNGFLESGVVATRSRPSMEEI